MLADADALALADLPPAEGLDDLLADARRVRDAHHGIRVTYSPKVFIPLTMLCRDVCHYCTFARPPRRGERAFLTVDEAVEIARQGAAAGCREALFTLGDKPELRYRAARDELAALGFDTTAAYLAHVAGAVLRETGLLPHANPGVLDDAELAALREVCPSQGIMLETTSDRLSQRGGAHFGSPDKVPSVRIDAIARAGRLRIPYTSGILIGIGETRRERVEALLALRDLHLEHGHLQEVIVQNFRAKAGTKMADAAEPSLDDHLWTIAVARLVLPPDVSLQAPPNLSGDEFPRLLDAGIDDFGGVSPVTPDHVNPEAPWPDVARLEQACADAGLTLLPAARRLPAVPRRPRALALRDDARPLARGLGRPRARPSRALDDRDAPRAPARLARRPPSTAGRRHLPRLRPGARARRAARAARRGRRDGAALRARPRGRAARERGRSPAARAGRRRRHLRRLPERQLHERLLLPLRLLRVLEGQARREPARAGLPPERRRGRATRRRGVAARRHRGLPAGRHPSRLHRALVPRAAAPRSRRPSRSIHVHAFSPLEVWQGAATAEWDLADYLQRLKDAGLGSLPGTAAEILDDDVRRILCPDKVSTAQWLEVMRTAHGVGLRSTATMMFGHIEPPRNQAKHLLAVRDLQRETGGFTEFVPLPFVADEAPIALRGRARSGPTFEEVVVVHAASRLLLDPWISHIQASWVKLGPEGARALLAAGVDDLGGTLMNESISRAAGAAHGQECPPEVMEAAIVAAGRTPSQRTTLYAAAPEGQVAASFGAPELEPTPVPPYDDGGLERPRRLIRPGLVGVS